MCVRASVNICSLASCAFRNIISEQSTTLVITEMYDPVSLLCGIKPDIPEIEQENLLSMQDEALVRMKRSLI